MKGPRFSGNKVFEHLGIWIVLICNQELFNFLISRPSYHMLLAFRNFQFFYINEKTISVEIYGHFLF